MATIRETLALACEHHRAGRIQSAEPLYRQILQVDPDNADALHLLGVIAYQTGQHQLADQHMRRAIEVNPNVADFHANLAAVHETLGNFDEAAACCRRALKLNPDSADAHNCLGNALKGQGRLQDAVDSYRRSLRSRPNSAGVRFNLGNALRARGNLDQAVACYREALKIQPDLVNAHLAWGATLRRQGKLDEAAARYRRVIDIKPDCVQAHHDLGDVLQQRNRLDDATACYRRSLEIDPDRAETHNSLGAALMGRGMMDEAEASLRRALELRPDYAEAHNNLGLVFGQRGMVVEAEASFRGALKLRPDYVDAHNNLGLVLRRREMFAEAEASFRRALELRPDCADAIGNLAILYEHLNRLEEAEYTATEGLRLWPDNVLINVGMAKCQERAGKFQQAIDRLEKLLDHMRPDGFVANDVQYQLGRLHDRLGNCDRAFAHFSRANRLTEQRTRVSPADKQVFFRVIDKLAGTFSPRWVDSWSAPAASDTERTPVFLVGFPRSGTTLLEVILGSHPRIQTLAEKPAAHAMERALHGMMDGYSGMADLTPDRIEELRGEYFRTADRFIDRDPRKILVDKYPLNLVNIGLILRVFPTARFIVALRHPCDVCLSCFMQNFNNNGAMIHFLTLEDTARTYDKVMSLWQQYLQVLPHPCHVIRYEDLVDDFDGQTRGLLEFIGADWDDAVRRYDKRAVAGRTVIRTPSYRQVSEPIYRRSCYRWRRYAEQLQPIMSVLQPYIEQFGYGDSDVRRPLDIKPNGAAVHYHRGNAFRDRGDYRRAIACYREALKSQPDLIKAHLAWGSALKRQGKLDDAVDRYRRALELKPDCVEAYNNLGTALKQQGRLHDAVDSYRRALEFQPDHVAVLNNLGTALSNLNELDEAEDCYRRAVEIQPEYPHTHNGLGNVLHMKGAYDEAEASYRRALEIRPDFPEAIGNLAILYELLNRLEEAESTATEGLLLWPNNALINVGMAKCEERKKQYQQAVDRLERVLASMRPDEIVANGIQYQLGRLYDRLGNSKRAFVHFNRGNQLTEQRIRLSPADKQAYSRVVDTLAKTFTPQWVDSWSAPAASGTEETPVFLVGFPRSGTTLLDVILDSHPRIQTLAEKPTVVAVEELVHGMPGGYPGALADLTAERIKELRGEYFRAADRFIDRDPRKVLIDKFPLNTVSTGLILRVFPSAKFIVALRHPCDVCLSCFMQRFEQNAAMIHFLTLEDTARLYDKVMNLWRQYLRVLPHRCHLVRYESLVEDFETETRRLLDFIGVPWDDAVRRYDKHAVRNRSINTPSYCQVSEPIYRRARYRWRRYAEQLEPIMEVLKPHIEYFGYGGPSVPRPHYMGDAAARPATLDS